jgi:hypothetical protein
LNGESTTHIAQAFVGCSARPVRVVGCGKTNTTAALPIERTTRRIVTAQYVIRDPSTCAASGSRCITNAGQQAWIGRIHGQQVVAFASDAASTHSRLDVTLVGVHELAPLVHICTDLTFRAIGCARNKLALQAPVAVATVVLIRSHMMIPYIGPCIPVLARIAVSAPLISRHDGSIPARIRQQWTIVDVELCDTGPTARLQRIGILNQAGIGHQRALTKRSTALTLRVETAWGSVQVHAGTTKIHIGVLLEFTVGAMCAGIIACHIAVATSNTFIAHQRRLTPDHCISIGSQYTLSV